MDQFWSTVCCFSEFPVESLPPRPFLCGAKRKAGIRVTVLARKTADSAADKQSAVTKLPEPRRRYFIDRVKEQVLARDQGMLSIVEEMLVCLKINLDQVKSKQIAYTKKKPGLKTLVLDLDETLVYATKQTGRFSQSVTYRNAHSGQQSTLWFSARPHVQWFLQEAARLFELVVFTAGRREYAQPLLSAIDPNGVISGVLFRDSCLSLQLSPPLRQIPNTKTKDLAGLGIPLAEVLLVDNSPFCYMLQPDNAVPILPYRGAQKDRQLPGLLEYLREAASAPSMVHFNRERFKLSHYRRFSSPAQLVTALY